jgi:hypothetical protein
VEDEEEGEEEMEVADKSEESESGTKSDSDITDDSSLDLTKSIADPLSIEGQQKGAILQVMREAKLLGKFESYITEVFADFSLGGEMQVGDCVEVLYHKESACAVLNMRSDVAVQVPWKTFLPIGTREFCDCAAGNCRCVYVDFAKNLEFRE